MMNRKLTGVFGILSPMLFIIGFGILYSFFNPKIFSATGGFMVVGFNVKGMQGLEWTKYFNYFFVGIVIIIFSIGLIKNTSNKGGNKAGKILILLSGIIYMTFGLIEIENSTDLFFWIYISQIVLTLSLGALGFILLSDNYLEIYNNKIIKNTILCFGILIFLNGVLEVIAQQVYPNFMGLFSWLLYFLGIGLIGLTLLIKPAHNIGYN